MSTLLILADGLSCYLFVANPRSDPELLTDPTTRPVLLEELWPPACLDPENPRDFFLNKPAELFLPPVNLDWERTFVEPDLLEIPENPPNLA